MIKHYDDRTGVELKESEISEIRVITPARSGDQRLEVGPESLAAFRVWLADATIGASPRGSTRDNALAVVRSLAFERPAMLPTFASFVRQVEEALKWQATDTVLFGLFRDFEAAWNAVEAVTPVPVVDAVEAVRRP